MWLVIVSLAYFLNAIAAVVDKFLISKKIPNPAVYVFYITLLGLLGVILAPWGFGWVGWWNFLVVLIVGLSFAWALLNLFKSLSLGESSRVTPFIGGMSPVFVFAFSFFLLGERLSFQQITALVFIILGTILISWGFSQKKNPGRAYLFALFAAVLFGVSYTLTKYSFNQISFVNGFVWIRLTAFVGGLLLLLKSTNRQAIFNYKKFDFKNSGSLFIFGQVAGAASFLLVNYAISLVSVTLVNALQGLQYIFLLLMVLILAKKYPYILEEKMNGKILIQKIAAIVLIGAGLFLLV